MATSKNEEEKKSRCFSITINNPTDEDKQNFIEEAAKAEYAVFQIEEGEEKTPHIQGMIYYKSQRIWPKKQFPRAHIEPARCAAALVRYCQKMNTRIEGPFEFGKKPEQGRRNDLEIIAGMIKNGASMRDIADIDPDAIIRYHKGLSVLENLYKNDRKEKPENNWLHGKAGVGKTKYVFENHEEVYIKDGTQWWDGYYGQKVICIDDFDGKWPFRDLLRLLDRYPYQGQVKGGYVKIAPTHIYITCEHHPKDIWAMASENERNQIYRRLNNIIEIKNEKQSWEMPKEFEITF